MTDNLPITVKRLGEAMNVLQFSQGEILALIALLQDDKYIAASAYSQLQHEIAQHGGEMFAPSSLVAKAHSMRTLC